MPGINSRGGLPSGAKKSRGPGVSNLKQNQGTSSVSGAGYKGASLNPNAFTIPKYGALGGGLGGGIGSGGLGGGLGSGGLGGGLGGGIGASNENKDEGEFGGRYKI